MGLLDEISKYTTPAAQLPDIEDDDFDETSAGKLISTKRLAKNNAIDFDEGKYAGKKVSRKDIFGESHEMSGLSAKAEELDDEEIEDEDAEDEEDEDENLDEDQQEGSDSEIEDEDDELIDEEEKEIPKISIPDTDTSVKKAECIQNQRKIWDDVMYTNIRMHALLNAVNQLPRDDSRKQLLGSANTATKENMKTALKNIGKMRKLLKDACECFAEKVEEDDDEEIPSDEDIGELNSENEDEDEGEDSDDEQVQIKVTEQGVSTEGLSKFLKKHDQDFDKFRATTITKWYNRTKLLYTKSSNNADFSVFEKGSVLTQINKALSDEAKLMKKVRTNRSGKSRIGFDASADIDDEIFDDGDFYQILLKQMIESRNAASNVTQDGADMTRSYMELQKMFNNKKKRDVTSLSSKDRKLKYEPIAKLINFYPANSSVVTWSHESRNELFKSLFS